MKLKSTLLLVFLFFTIVPIFVLSILAINHYNSKMEKILENDLSVATSTQVESVNNFLHEREINLSIIADYEPVRSLLNQSLIKDSEDYLLKKKIVDDMLDVRSNRNEYVVSISIIDLDFKIITSSVPVEQGAISKLKNVHPKYLTGQFSFTPVLESHTGDVNQRVLVAVEGIYEDEKLVGYLVEEMNLSFFEKVRVAANLFNNGTIYLLDGSGNIITAGSATDSRTEYVLNIEQRRGYINAWEKENANNINSEGFLRFQALGNHYLSYYSFFQNSDWFIISTINLDQVLQTKINYQNLILLIIAIVCLLFISIHTIISSKIMKPLEEMIQKFSLIRENQDYSIRMNSTTSHEFQIISTEINSLLTNVEKNIKLEKQKQKRLMKKASTDSLTGLFNKKAIAEIIENKLDDLYIENKKIALLFIDVDDFKDFNSNYGHSGGDQALCFAARVIQKYCNPSGRIGGDEFVGCILDADSASTVKDAIKKMMKELERGFLLEGYENRIPMHCSIGAVFSEGDRPFYDQLLEQADKAMYQVKNDNKNNFLIKNLSI